MRVIRSASMIALLCLAAIAPSALAQEVTPDDATASPALSGQIVAAGKCPVPLGGLEGGRACPDRPLQTTVLILTADAQQQVASVPTAMDGTFSVSLAPGQYVVDPLLADGTSPASPVNVAVPDDGFVTIRVTGGSAARVSPNS